ncbi:bifunctional phosphoribosyl-AMP cyclohydrolase/phosphoribosyl-ATP diphosphatase HisIE [Hyphobacterium sp. CCMP332]|uniref:bifunctional phosphoribosyl-AMP cyclohydrolase/phosphoribosyl-ATP diphosphatase HisIE n=1 Tax=Hyphobacterium sp. CCMP332 TaxID=2749086 RepID=UPI0016503D20|nr:bifunctional phosphoribosyl-AMP cyclohydrolase/phosphoribosyl-ATP diphosphatase HisIE [Hyphobacterium sp. CCMP332]QNL18837.1 bifunctional phosphoribosyl-AMP cyclohydrolase/phosphoribosyl-ATP diphosphatase HisIE [Hyphobacterium sp. CCMP332]
MINPDDIDFAKGEGLVPAIVQHAETSQVLMLGYMNREAVDVTIKENVVTFYSRSKKRLWKKGETSGNTLALVVIHIDCDRDTLLVKALPAGPVCHTGTPTCFGDDAPASPGFLNTLERVIDERRLADPEKSYVARLNTAGLNKLAQKVGEEGVETALAGVSEDDDALKGEAADLIFHLMMLLRARGLSLADVVSTLEARHR